MIRVTARQRDVLREIRRFQRKHGYTQSVRELCEALGVSSTATIQSHLNALSRKGCVTRIPNTERSLVITEAGHAVLNGSVEEART